MHTTIHQDIFNIISEHENSRVYFKHDPTTNLKAIIAINGYTNQPTLGGCRCVPYQSAYAAIEDALLLAKAMTMKSAIAGVPFGGGKAVLINNEEITDRKAYFSSYGKFVDSLQGKYITAVDSGTNLDDMDIVHQQTKYVSSTSKMDSSPAPYTALGVYHGIRAAVKCQLKRDSLKGIHVAVQGAGAVGLPLCQLLHDAGANITVADINDDNIEHIAKKLPVTVVSPQEIFKVAADIFSPNALGASINDNTIEQLKVAIVAGAANNQLAQSNHGEKLRQKNILFAPDYVINAGGLIYAANTYLGVPTSIIKQHCENIYNTLTNIFNDPRIHELPTQIIANLLAKNILENMN